MNSKLLAPLFVFALAPLAATRATAQTPPTPQTPGPMIIERVHSGWLFAPDAKVTKVDHTTSELIGGYGGWITDDTFFIGAGGYWLANPTRDREMGYGGLVVQWLAGSNRRFGYSVKGLVGGGGSTLSTTLSQLVRLPDVRFFDPRDSRFDQRVNQVLTTRQVRTRQAFFVAEPEADVLVRLTRHMRLTAGVGYRAVAAERDNDSRLRGAVGALGLQIGGGS